MDYGFLLIFICTCNVLCATNIIIIDLLFGISLSISAYQEYLYSISLSLLLLLAFSINLSVLISVNSAVSLEMLTILERHTL